MMHNTGKRSTTAFWIFGVVLALASGRGASALPTPQDQPGSPDVNKPTEKPQEEPKPLLPDVDKPAPKPAAEEKAPPKKKGAAGRIAEQQAAETALKDAKMPPPRQPEKAFIEFAEPLGWPVFDAPNAGDKVLYAFKMSDPKKKRDKAVLAVSFVPEREGKASTVLKNWCEGFIKDDGSKPRLAEVAQEFEVNSLKVTLIELKGATKGGKSGKPVAGQMMIAAVVHHPKGPFFIRAEGKASTLEPQRERILKFIRSVRPATPTSKAEKPQDPAVGKAAASSGDQPTSTPSKPGAGASGTAPKEPAAPPDDKKPGSNPG
ncbi:MAG: hypothetical protein KJ057_11495 [Phycisphaerae bacterium]|nr:MAG: hypothetical protein EDS66_06495 [Planctomycetota bacterium]KAB2948240.1 MAG: hypothetical protein F9K17_06430 [Phycisphaerae bacterium]MBE7457852.1 hypothetical protein [Planctomycetia bacterium]MCK6465751.1 hypothetical protein [Phycisphaerae bacterium]MCL4719085.1 hypothetical protein [Phycisphaerae bacterium]